MTRAIALILTVMTGFSGLVYEIAWQKYLATLLGSHSEATAAVLAIFLGGLSVGYWLFGVVTRRVAENAARAGTPPRLLLVYGGLEFSIGVYVIAFPWLFKVVQALSFAIPHGSGGFGFALDVALTVLLIGPASVMMGGTIPILTQALWRSLDDATRFHAFIYAFNTAGAFAGAIAAGFYLIPVLGLKNLMLAMGTINLFAGAVFILIGFRGQHVYAEPADEPTAEAVGLELVLRTYSSVFDHLAIWGSVSSDLLILGFNDPGKAQDVYRIEERFNRSDFSASFNRAGVSSITDLFSHELVPMDVIQEIELRGPLHSLYHPRLSHTAGIAFFRGDTAQSPFTGFGKAAKVGAKRSMLGRYRVRTGGRLSDHDRAAAILETCDVFMHRCQTMLAQWMSEAPTSDAFHETFKVLDPRAKHSQAGQVHGLVANADDMKLMATLFDRASPEYASKSQRSLDEAWRATELYIDYYHHNAPFDPSALLDVWSTLSRSCNRGCQVQGSIGPNSPPQKSSA